MSSDPSSMNLKEISVELTSVADDLTTLVGKLTLITTSLSDCSLVLNGMGLDKAAVKAEAAQIMVDRLTGEVMDFGHTLGEIGTQVLLARYESGEGGLAAD